MERRVHGRGIEAFWPRWLRSQRRRVVDARPTGGGLASRPATTSDSRGRAGERPHFGRDHHHARRAAGGWRTNSPGLHAPPESPIIRQLRLRRRVKGAHRKRAEDAAPTAADEVDRWPRPSSNAPPPVDKTLTRMTAATPPLVSTAHARSICDRLPGTGRRRRLR